MEHSGGDRYARESLVTDTEDVSYVSSPYLPMCLRHGGREITSNASKAHLSSGGETNIRDELDEVGATAGTHLTKRSAVHSGSGPEQCIYSSWRVYPFWREPDAVAQPQAWSHRKSAGEAPALSRRTEGGSRVGSSQPWLTKRAVAPSSKSLLDSQK